MRGFFFFFLVNSWDNRNHSCSFSDLLEDVFSSVRPTIQSWSRVDLITEGGVEKAPIHHFSGSKTHTAEISWQRLRVPAHTDCSCSSQRGVWWWMHWQKNLIIQTGEVTCTLLLSAKGAGWAWLTTRELLLWFVCLSAQLAAKLKNRQLKNVPK